MQTQIRRLTDRFIEALSRFEREGEEQLDPLVELFSPKAQLTNPFTESAGVQCVGREGVRRFWRTYRDVLGEAESLFSHVMTDNNAASLFWRTRAYGHHARGWEYDGVTLLEFDAEGLIQFLRAYFDRDAMTRAVHGDLAAAPLR